MLSEIEEDEENVGGLGPRRRRLLAILRGDVVGDQTGEEQGPIRRQRCGRRGRDPTQDERKGEEPEKTSEDKSQDEANLEEESTGKGDNEVIMEEADLVMEKGDETGDGNQADDGKMGKKCGRRCHRRGRSSSSSSSSSSDDSDGDGEKEPKKWKHHHFGKKDKDAKKIRKALKKNKGWCKRQMKHGKSEGKGDESTTGGRLGCRRRRMINMLLSEIAGSDLPAGRMPGFVGRRRMMRRKPWKMMRRSGWF